MTREEINQLEAYLRKRFGLANLEVRQRPTKDDSADVHIGEEFIGVLFKDDEDGDLAYNFTMSILDYDLEDT